MNWTIRCLLPVCLLIFSACGKGEKILTTPFSENCWRIDDTLAVTLDWNQSDERVGLDLVVDFTSEYPYNNLFLWLETTDPQGKIYQEKLEFLLMNPAGKWFGGQGESPEIRLGLRPLNLMPLSGAYRFRLVQDMQDDALCGIKGVSIQLIN